MDSTAVAISVVPRPVAMDAVVLPEETIISDPSQSTIASSNPPLTFRATRSILFSSRIWITAQDTSLIIMAASSSRHALLPPPRRAECAAPSSRAWTERKLEPHLRWRR